MRNLFESRPGYDATIYAEAQALIDDGLDLEFVLGLFPADAPWLEGMLDYSEAIIDAVSADPPSYYFEASLKNRFVAAGVRASRPAAPEPVFALGRMRTAAATMSVGLSAAVVSAVTFGFVTAGSAVPGDWNYSFKLANERLEYTLSRGDSRVDVQFRQAEARAQEIRVLTSRGDVSAGDLQSLEREARNLADLARSQPLDDEQRERLKGITNRSTAMLNEIRQKQPALEPEVSAAAAAVNDAATTALATVPTAGSTPTAITSPTPPASPETSTATPAGSSTPESTATATPTPTPGGSSTGTPESGTPGATSTAAP